MWLSLGEYPVGSRNDQRPRNARYVNKLTSRVSVFPFADDLAQIPPILMPSSTLEPVSSDLSDILRSWQLSPA